MHLQFYEGKYQLKEPHESKKACTYIHKFCKTATYDLL